MRRKRSAHRLSNFARVIVRFRSWPSARVSTSIAACVAELRVRFARSQAVRRRRRARALPSRVMRVFLRNSSAQNVTSAVSKSSPPKWPSPAVAFTSKIPSSIVSTVKSCVPPPQSNTRIFFSPLSVTLSRP